MERGENYKIKNFNRNNDHGTENRSVGQDRKRRGKPMELWSPGP